MSTKAVCYFCFFETGCPAAKTVLELSVAEDSFQSPPPPPPAPTLWYRHLSPAKIDYRGVRTVLALCGSGNETQGFEHPRRALSQLQPRPSAALAAESGLDLASGLPSSLLSGEEP